MLAWELVVLDRTIIRCCRSTCSHCPVPALDDVTVAVEDDVTAIEKAEVFELVNWSVIMLSKRFPDGSQSALNITENKNKQKLK